MPTLVSGDGWELHENDTRGYALRFRGIGAQGVITAVNVTDEQALAILTADALGP